MIRPSLIVLSFALVLLGCNRSDVAAANTEPALAANKTESQQPPIEDTPSRASAIEADPRPADPSIEEQAPDALAMTRVWKGDLDAMVERRIIRVLTVYGPGRYFLDDGPRGVTAEYAVRLEKIVNEAYKTGHLKVAVVVIPVARDQLFSALNAGRGDIVIAGTTITDARGQSVDFTIPASKPLKEILVTGPTAPAITNLDQLSGETVYVRASSSYASSVKKLSDRLVAKGKAPITIEYMSELLEDEDLVEMVDAGMLPWAVVDSYKPQLWEGAFEKTRPREDLVLREGGRLAWAIRKESPELKAFLNNFLKESREGTLFGNIVRNRYLKNFDWAENATSAAELRRYRDLEQYFSRFGDAYDVDPALLAAQGFQESRLDQSVRSHAGAIGIMQLLKSTALDKNVGIPNIEEVEPNIEAGAKYLNFLRSRYFENEGIDKLNSSLLALAAYNAGPAKVRRLQRMAEERGYNPNVWFDNVEVIAAEVIGRETVQYVANIYKYYLTYQMINRQSALREAAREAAGVGVESN